MMNITVLMTYAVSSVVLPPLNLVLLCFIGILLSRRFPRLGKGLSTGALVLLLVLSTGAGSLLLVAPLEHRTAPLASTKDTGAQAIVVLSAGRLSDAPEYGGMDVASNVELARLRYAAKLYRETGLPVLISGGAPDASKEPEAAVMARSLREDFHVPVQWLEEKSNTTAENAMFSSRILLAAGIRRILLVTDALHMPRARAVFDVSGLEVVPAPTSFFSAQRFSPLDFIPSGEPLRRSHYAAHEWIGLLWYRLRHGTASSGAPAE